MMVRFSGIIVLILICLALPACRLRVGEDMAPDNPMELAELIKNLKYMKDAHGICYAVLANSTDGFRTTFTFSEVDCARAGL